MPSHSFVCYILIVVEYSWKKDVHPLHLSVHWRQTTFIPFCIYYFYYSSFSTRNNFRKAKWAITTTKQKMKKINLIDFFFVYQLSIFLLIKIEKRRTLAHPVWKIRKEKRRKRKILKCTHWNNNNFKNINQWNFFLQRCGHKYNDKKGDCLLVCCQMLH